VVWTEVLIAVLGLTATGLTWYFKRKQSKPLEDRLSLQHENYQMLLAKYAAVVKERNELREFTQDLERQLYEGYDITDLIGNANRMPKFHDDESN